MQKTHLQKKLIIVVNKMDLNSELNIELNSDIDTEGNKQNKKNDLNNSEIFILWSLAIPILTDAAKQHECPTYL